MGVWDTLSKIGTGVVSQNWENIFFGAAAAGTVAGMFTDPSKGVREALEQQAQQNLVAQRQWQEQQKKMFDFQIQDATQRAALQKEYMGQYGDILTGKTDVASSPMFASQFGNMRNAQTQMMSRIMEQMPPGGARERAIKQARTGFADQQAQSSGAINKWIFDQAGQLKLPYQMPGAGGPSGSASSLSALDALQQRQGFDPSAFLKLSQGYGNLKKPPKPTPAPEKGPPPVGGPFTAV